MSNEEQVQKEEEIEIYIDDALEARYHNHR